MSQLEEFYINTYLRARFCRRSLTDTNTASQLLFQQRRRRNIPSSILSDLRRVRWLNIGPLGNNVALRRVVQLLSGHQIRATG